MIQANGVIKIIDFGAIKIAGVQEISSPVKRHDLLGTRDYTAPEYLFGVAASKQSDLFSIAVIVYEMLTGHLPYGDQLNKAESIRDIDKLQYTLSYHYNPMIPIWFDGALRKALSCEPGLRYGTLSEFLTDLKNPNEQFFSKSIPLSERNPLRLWQMIAGISIAANLAAAYFLFSPGS